MITLGNTWLPSLSINLNKSLLSLRVLSQDDVISSEGKFYYFQLVILGLEVSIWQWINGDWIQIVVEDSI